MRNRVNTDPDKEACGVFGYAPGGVYGGQMTPTEQGGCARD